MSTVRITQQNQRLAAMCPSHPNCTNQGNDEG